MINYILFSRNNKKLYDYGIKNPVIKKSNMGANKMDEKDLNGFKKVEDLIFKFEKEGDSIKGILLDAEESKSYDNMVYKIKRSDDNKTVTIFGTTVLDSKLKLVPVGKEVVILMSGEKESSKGKNPIKLFDVYVKN